MGRNTTLHRAKIVKPFAMNTELLPNSSRRQFLVSAAGLAATGLVTASPLPLLSVQNPEDAKPEMRTPTPLRLHLDLPEAIRIANQFVLKGGIVPDLDLADYASASLDALDYLAHLDVCLVFLGIENLNVAMAERIVRWHPGFLIFENLDKLTPDAAKVLSRSDHQIDLGLKCLDVETAKQLVSRRPEPNSLGIGLYYLEEISLPLAEVLSADENALRLGVDSLSTKAAKALSCHRGHYLSITSKSSFATESLRAFAQSDPNKRLTFATSFNRSSSQWEDTIVQDAKPWWWRDRGFNCG